MADVGSFDLYIIIRLAVAAILGGIIGLERGGTNHDAGLRTHTILCLGAAAVMVISEGIVRRYGETQDFMRMGAQVISGVGFLGAGSIIVNGNRIKGITTAAGLWATACVGLAVGSGFYVVAIWVVALMLFAMLGLRSLGKRLKRGAKFTHIKLDFGNSKRIKDVIEALNEDHIRINSIYFQDNDSGTDMVVEIQISRRVNASEVIENLGTKHGVKSFTDISRGAVKR